MVFKNPFPLETFKNIFWIYFLNDVWIWSIKYIFLNVYIPINDEDKRNGHFQIFLMVLWISTEI